MPKQYITVKLSHSREDDTNGFLTERAESSRKGRGEINMRERERGSYYVHWTRREAALSLSLSVQACQIAVSKYYRSTHKHTRARQWLFIRRDAAFIHATDRTYYVCVDSPFDGQFRFHNSLSLSRLIMHAYPHPHALNITYIPPLILRVHLVLSWFIHPI